MTIKPEKVIIVNEKDEWLGTMEKQQAHEEGVLHRAFSVFVLNAKGELLLQQRALHKYHSAGLWSNACCSHPRPGESTMAAAHRRLVEEMGFDCPLEPIFTLRYKSDVGNGLTENEYDHIYLGKYSGAVLPAAEEVNDFKYLPINLVSEQMRAQPESFSAWFHLAMPKFILLLESKTQIT